MLQINIIYYYIIFFRKIKDLFTYLFKIFKKYCPDDIQCGHLRQMKELGNDLDNRGYPRRYRKILT